MPPGLAARQLAAALIYGVLVERQPLEQLLATSLATAYGGLEPRDRALVRAVAATVLRRQGELESVLGGMLTWPVAPGSGRLKAVLLSAAAQLLCLDMPAHAVVDLAVETARRDRSAHRFARLVNAVLRRVAGEGRALLAELDGERVNIPDWLWQRWTRAYGAAGARHIAEASLRPAPLDIALKDRAPSALGPWAERVGGRVLPTGGIRLDPHGRIEDMAGYAEGAWWVQDAAAQLIPRLVGNVAGHSVADLCAAPGGKTAALAAAGARVTAVDVSAPRLERLRGNLARLRLGAEVVTADASRWSPGATFAAVILDAPCTATGTIRRHPDILRLKRAEDVRRMAELQSAMLGNAATLLQPRGVLVFCTCSLEPEEGEQQAQAFLATRGDFERVPIDPAEIAAAPEWITGLGDLRTLPFHLPQQPSEFSGMDGFYAVRLRRKA
jgi:16S rRNA (cytosine967-C5)-methyltransferase